MRKIKKGDDVIVITGKDKGKRGAVARVVDAGHVLVDGINRVKKHQRPNPQKNQQGGIVEKDMPLHVSNVQTFLSSHATASPAHLPLAHVSTQVHASLSLHAPR